MRKLGEHLDLPQTTATHCNTLRSTSNQSSEHCEVNQPPHERQHNAATHLCIGAMQVGKHFYTLHVVQCVTCVCITSCVSVSERGRYEFVTLSCCFLYITCCAMCDMCMYHVLCLCMYCILWLYITGCVYVYMSVYYILCLCIHVYILHLVSMYVLQLASMYTCVCISWCVYVYMSVFTCCVCNVVPMYTWRGGGLGSRPKKMYGERLGDGVEYHLMKPTPRR